ncbi:TPA: replication initiation protein [Campylobacter fetus subsp. venerealis]|nr:replication initiation protein [Campylobacter fetus subsp. venerealis]HDX6264138.1 replication initiation protein [Campylobacter fetus subsp. venerealis]HDX6277984.1 replication initiation protein [Campylobacter fetus subsp. venerealis]HDX6300064.1 replication initiation protein [Campylobacter fetus subsp. venerealis]HDX8122391.1 replication initiation protein [Campylobacter fetus subsp. venerealis]
MAKKIDKNEIVEVRNLSDRKVVTQANAMINSKYTLNLSEQRLILFAIAQIDSVNDESFFKFSCTVRELEKELGIELKESRLKDLAMNILKKPLLIKEGINWIACNWFSSFKYYGGEARMEFKISDDLVPYLLKLKEKFTTYSLEVAIQFQGKYTTRFYEFCMQVRNQNKKEIIFELDFLYELLQLPKTMRAFGQFKRDVLDPSINEINEKTEIKANYEAIKTGRKYTNLILSWEYA